MKLNKYFGEVKKDYCGFSAQNTFEIPYLKTYNNTESIKIYLGEQFDSDNDWKEFENPPSITKLNEYENTLKTFIMEIDNIFINVQFETFEHYKSVYAKYYEQPFFAMFENIKIQKNENDKLNSPLCIDNKEKHFEYIEGILESIRILDNNTIKIPFSYYIDEEHGLELKIVNNIVEKVGGIAET
ncbi:hypothetical protein [Tenacibaculum finnmarkense]|uniref:hypothetical protein n=1 Tax=Tenacibaculum finnmarkense TaxID=2781243 RepID=UPI001E305AFD|nr:hypothetical protein [Tenacibaculum finnmarkense]MCD8413715.1 hypothetical protein [Tenacibaculum finnmarkense genomovar ulcerans]